MKKEGHYADAQIVIPPESPWGIARRRTVILSGTIDEINQGFEVLLNLADRHKITGEISLDIGEPLVLPRSHRPFRGLRSLNEPVEEAFRTDNITRSLRFNDWLTTHYLKNIIEFEPNPQILRSEEYVDPALREMANYPYPEYQTNSDFLFKAATFIEQSLFTANYGVRPLAHISGIGNPEQLAERYGVSPGYVMSEEVPRFALTTTRAIVAPTYLRRAMTKIVTSFYDPRDMSEQDFYLGIEVIRRLAKRYGEIWPDKKRLLSISEAYGNRNLMNAILNSDWLSEQTVMEGFLQDEAPQKKRFRTFIDAAVPRNGGLFEEVFNAIRYRLALPAFLMSQTKILEEPDREAFRSLLSKLSDETTEVIPINTYLMLIYRTMQCLIAPEDVRWQTIQHFCHTAKEVFTEEETVIFTQLVRHAAKDFIDNRV